MFSRRKKSKKLKSLPDEDLINGIRELRDVESFNELYSRYSDLAYYAALGILKDPVRSKDVVSIVFEKVWFKLQETRVRSFSNWLFFIIRNECIDQLRREKKLEKQKQEYEKFSESEFEDVENDAYSRLLSGGLSISDEILETAVASLEKKQQACIRYFYFEQKSYKEVAVL